MIKVVFRYLTDKGIGTLMCNLDMAQEGYKRQFFCIF